MLQASALAATVRAARQRRDVNVICYSGYTLGELRQQPPTPGVPDLLDQVDVLIDGRYQEAANDGKGLRGSSNQVVHHLTGRLSGASEALVGGPRTAEILEHLLDGSFADEGLEQYAAAYLGAVRLRQGDPDTAMPLLRRGAGSRDPDVAAYACLTWGLYLFEIGDVTGADEVLTAAREIDHAEVADSVLAGLGMVRLAQRRLDEAYVLLKGVLDGGNRDEEPKVRRYLGSVLARQGRPAEARAVLEPLAASDDSEHRPAGLLLLGRLAWQDKDIEDGRRWLTAAIEAGDREVEAEARSELGQMLAQAGEIEASREVLSPLIGQSSAASGRAEAFLGTLTGVPDAAAPAPSGRPALAGRRAVPAETTTASPAPAPGKPSRPGLTPLPSAVLSLLAEVADADGQPAEAEYWRGLARAQDPAGASPAGG